jgi:mannose-6-phosphate isomerase
VAARFDGKLPFLFKVLAAERPLSIQAHPNLEQARAGFARENAAGIPLDAPNRCYKDPNHKPELICALTPFSALSGFRAIDEIIERFEALGTSALNDTIAKLGSDSDRGSLSHFFRDLMTLDRELRRAILVRAQKVAKHHGAGDAVWSWVARLGNLYPDDTSVLAPLYLNLVPLDSGEALYLPAGEPHSYLTGVGVEIMANSDNVLRGGLTRKHIALEELLNTLTFSIDAVQSLTPMRTASDVQSFLPPVEEFALTIYREAPPGGWEIPCDRGAEILLCTQGSIRVRSRRGEDELTLPRGACLLIPAMAESYCLEGEGTVFRATTGISTSSRQDVKGGVVT